MKKEPPAKYSLIVGWKTQKRKKNEKNKRKRRKENIKK